MPPRKKTKKKEVADYRHEDATRPNNPSAALARDDTGETPKVKYEFDPHRDPELVWAGKAEQPEIEVDAPSLHIHERISAEAILRHAQREEAELTLFADPEMDRSKAIEFYEHEMGWANRLILGDSLHVMASLLERERMAGKVQLIYIDPPYGIGYNSNFQPGISSRNVKDGQDNFLTREPEMIQAYRDTWELGIHSYLGYLRERLLLSRELLAQPGSVVVQIGSANVHLVQGLLDEVFGRDNRCPTITIQKTSGHDSRLIPDVTDYLLWYAKDKQNVTFHHLFASRGSPINDPDYRRIELKDGSRRTMTPEERANPNLVPSDSRIFRYDQITTAGNSRVFSFEYEGEVFEPPKGRQWALRLEGLEGLVDSRRIDKDGSNLAYVRYLDDFGAIRRTNIWTDTGQAGARGSKKRYVVETNPKIIERVIAMLSDPGDLVMDPTCGSGTVAWTAEKLGRRWITVDTSRVALAIARERVMTGRFDYFKLRDPERGVDSGFHYKEVKRITASAIGYGREPEVEPFLDQPAKTGGVIRVSGPFTVESLSRYGENPNAKDLKVPESLITGDEEAKGEDAGDHRDLLLDALRHHGIPVQGAKPLKLESIEPIAGSGEIHAEGTAKKGKEDISIAVSIGPRYGPVTQIQVDDALDEAKGYDLVCFIGFAATAEVQKYLAPGKRGKVDVALVEANADLLLGDLLKNTSGSQTFRLFSSPDAEVKTAEGGEFVLELHGMDTYDAATGEVTSRNRDEIAAWFLDHDYDGTVFHVNQAFFTRADAWDALKKALKAEIDPEALEALNGFESLPFKPGESGRAAIRVIDDAGQTSEMVLELGA